MYSRQPTLCVAAWTDQEASRAGGYRFTVLRHEAPHHPYFWLLRTPVDDDGPTFSGVLFNDLVADKSPFVNETRNYVGVDFRRDADVHSLCADEYEICWDSTMEVSARSTWSPPDHCRVQ